METHGYRERVFVQTPQFAGLIALLVCVGMSLLLPARPAVAGAEPAAACAAAKQKAAAKALSTKIKCHGNAMKKGTGLDRECLSKADQKLDSAFEKAENKGGCVTTADAAAAKSTVNAVVEDLFDNIPRGTCPAACKNPLTAVTLHGGTHFDSSRSCYFDFARQAGSVSWKGGTIGFPAGHDDEIRVSNGQCLVTEEDVPKINMVLTDAEQAACAPIAAEAVLNFVGYVPCDVFP